MLLQWLYITILYHTAGSNDVVVHISYVVFCLTDCSDGHGFIFFLVPRMARIYTDELFMYCLFRSSVDPVFYLDALYILEMSNIISHHYHITGNGCAAYYQIEVFNWCATLP